MNEKRPVLTVGTPTHDIYIGPDAYGRLRLEVWTHGGTLTHGEPIPAEMYDALAAAWGDTATVDTYMDQLDGDAQ